MGTPTHPRLADIEVLWSDTASTWRTHASLHGYIILHSWVRSHLTHSTPPEICHTSFLTSCLQSHITQACWYCGSLIWHSIYMMYTSLLAEVQNITCLSKFTLYTPWNLLGTIFTFMFAVCDTPPACWYCGSLIWHSIDVMHNSLLARVHNITCISTFTLTTLYTTSPPMNSARNHLILLWALPHTSSLLILWYFALTQHLHDAHMPPCRSTENYMHE